MNTLISYIAGWTAGYNAAAPAVQVEFHQRGGPKPSAWIMIEGPVNAGQLTVWNTGEVEVEAYAISTSERVHAESVQLTSEGELGHRLEQLASICRAGEAPGTG